MCFAIVSRNSSFIYVYMISSKYNLLFLIAYSLQHFTQFRPAKSVSDRIGIEDHMADICRSMEKLLIFISFNFLFFFIFCHS